MSPVIKRRVKGVGKRGCSVYIKEVGKWLVGVKMASSGGKVAEKWGKKLK